MRATVVGTVVTALVGSGLASGCGVSVSGDFDGIPWTPDSAIMAVADRQDLLLRGGAVVPVKKNPGGQTIDLLLTAARVDVNQDWRRAPIDTLLEIRRELSTSDAILLESIPLDPFSAGTVLTATVEDGRSSGDFSVAVGAALPTAALVAEQGLGSKLQITLTPQSLDARPRGGSIAASVEVQREREAGQDGSVATGTVTLSFSASLLPERLTESNLTIAVPIIECMQAQGPASEGICRDVAPLPYVDETGVVDP